MWDKCIGVISWIFGEVWLISPVLFFDLISPVWSVIVSDDLFEYELFDLASQSG